jgi:hypothetical protein
MLANGICEKVSKFQSWRGAALPLSSLWGGLKAALCYLFEKLQTRFCIQSG